MRGETRYWIDRHGIERVDLLGDFHAADFRGHGRAGAPGDHESGEHRTELAQDAEGDRGAEKIFCVEFSQAVIALQTHDHAGKNARQNHHGERLNADGTNVMNDQTQPSRWAKRPGKRRQEKQERSSHPDRPLDCAAADLTNPRKHKVFGNTCVTSLWLLQNRRRFFKNPRVARFAETA